MLENQEVGARHLMIDDDDINLTGGKIIAYGVRRY